MKQFTRKNIQYVIKDGEVYRLPFTNGKRTLPLKKCLKSDKGYSLSGETVSFAWVEKNAVECDVDLTNINI